jgi:hypothetical protein
MPPGHAADSHPTKLTTVMNTMAVTEHGTHVPRYRERQTVSTSAFAGRYLPCTIDKMKRVPTTCPENHFPRVL